MILFFLFFLLIGESNSHHKSLTLFHEPSSFTQFPGDVIFIFQSEEDPWEKLRQTYQGGKGLKIIHKFLEGSDSFNAFSRRLLGEYLFKRNFLSILNQQTKLIENKLDFFIYFNRVNNLPLQGWKIHINATEESLFKICKVVLPYLDKYNISFKIVKRKEWIRILNQHETQRGKIITIYPQDNLLALSTALDLDELFQKANFSPDSFCPPPFELPLGKTGALTTRYGALAVPDEHLFHIQRLNEDGTLTGQWIDDDRTRPFPSFIKEHPFEDLIDNDLFEKYLVKN